MSLILDALKQAEHERGGDRAPDLFNPNAGPAFPPSATPPAPRWPWVLATTALVGMALALFWTLWPRPPAAPPAQPVTVAPAAPQPVAPEPLFRPTTPGPVVTTAPTAQAAAAAPPQQGPSAGPATPTYVDPVTQATAGAASPAPPAVSELPTETRARLPQLNITGHTYSDNPTLRMLMIDGRMFVEGQSVQPGLRLERIGPHQAVFNQSGTRFTVNY